MKNKLLLPLFVVCFFNILELSAQCVTKDVNIVFCLSESYLDKTVSYISNNDLDAVQSLIDAGFCSFIAPNVTVYLESSTWTGKVEIRPKGSTSTVWTLREAIDCR